MHRRITLWGRFARPDLSGYISDSSYSDRANHYYRRHQWDGQRGPEWIDRRWRESWY